MALENKLGDMTREPDERPSFASGDVWLDEEENTEIYEEEKPKCGCKLCYCLNSTEYGERCDDCSRGVHQG